MKHVINIIGLVIFFSELFYTAHYVQAGDICRTIFGCFAMWTWCHFNKKEK